MPWLTLELRNEIHHLLTKEQMLDIMDFRSAIMYKTEEQTMKLLYEWTKTGKLNLRQFKSAIIYVTK